MTDGRRSRAWILLGVGALVAFALHFRPWEVGFMEEWPLADDWGGGSAFTANYLEWTLSRPLHLLPTFLGLALTGGAPGGIFIVLGVVAAAQFVLTVWAVRPFAPPLWVSTAVALVVALHPLWPGGYLQRFLPAQTAALLVVVMIGFVARWLLEGRRRWLIAGGAALLVGLAVYPGPAAAAPLAALVLALAVDAPLRRRIAAVAVPLGASAIMTAYSLGISRLIAPGGESYEAGNIAVAAVDGPRQFVTLVASTFLYQGAGLLVGILVLAVLGAVLSLTGIVPERLGWLMAGAAAASPLATVVFFGHVGWLQDVDRIGYATSLVLVAGLLVWPIAGLRTRPRSSNALAAALAVVTLLGGVAGILVWQPAISLQHRLLDALAPVVAEAGEGETVVVVDRSGTYGTMNTFPLQYLDAASHVWNADDTPVLLCFDETGLTPVPSGGIACDSADPGEELRLAATLTLESGDVDIYLGRQESDD